MRDPDTEQPDSWSEYRRLVTSGLRELDTDIKNLDSRFQTMQLQFTKDITALQTKAGIWGGFVGAIVAGIIAITAALIEKGK